MINIRNLGIFMAAIGTFFIAIIAALPEGYIERQLTLKKGTQADTSTQRRAAYQRAGIKSFLKHPFLGTGPFTFRMIWLNSEEIKAFKFTPRPAHNTYMDILTGSGILGLVSFLALIIAAYRDIKKAELMALNFLGHDPLTMLIKSYRIAFTSSFLYLFIMSAFEHKLFLLGLSYSQMLKGLVKERINSITQGNVQRQEV
jgi:O-antigen ligase